MKHFLKSSFFWFTLTAIVLLSVSVWLTLRHWDWLHASASTTASNSETLRNVGLLIGGLLAFLFAMWRGWLAERQSFTTQRQADIAEQSLLDERYQRGAEMLGSSVLSVRIGGVYALKRLAEDRPQEYHVPVMELFCAFLRDPTRYGDGTEQPPPQWHPLRGDVQEVISAICERKDAGIEYERIRNFRLDLHRVDFSETDLSKGTLTHADLREANFAYASLNQTDLSNATLWRTDLIAANLSDAHLFNADLSEAILEGADLSGAELCRTDAHSLIYKVPARGLTQTQLDTAHAGPNNPPKLQGVLDAATGKQLVWRGAASDR